jgi:hypothetical protein
MNNYNFLVFSHEQELDGLFSATVLRMIYPQSEVILTNYGCENMVAMKNNILYKIIAELEQGRIDPELLKITIRLAKSPSDYAVNNPNKKIGMLLGAKAGDLI